MIEVVNTDWTQWDRYSRPRSSIYPCILPYTLKIQLLRCYVAEDGKLKFAEARSLYICSRFVLVAICRRTKIWKFNKRKAVMFSGFSRHLSVSSKIFSQAFKWFCVVVFLIFDSASSTQTNFKFTKFITLNFFYPLSLLALLQYCFIGYTHNCSCFLFLQYLNLDNTLSCNRKKKRCFTITKNVPDDNNFYTRSN